MMERFDHYDSIREVFLKCGEVLDEKIHQSLKEIGVNNFFPVQEEVIPILLRQNRYLSVVPRDICVSAPTGSGKTISYVLPIIHMLNRDRPLTKRLTALILQPSRELALQVHLVIQKLSKYTNIKVEVATGQMDYYVEKTLIVESSEANVGRNLLSAKTFNSLIDILVCTPGRLLEHLQSTEGFTLQHLRFLVLDEADRLLGNAYHNWVRLLLQSSSGFNLNSQLIMDNQKSDGISISCPTIVKASNRMQRLLFSATLTDNPSKLAMLGIFNPLLLLIRASPPTGTLGTPNNAPFAATPDFRRFSLPPQLSESTVICEAKVKPLTLLALLSEAFSSSEKDCDPPRSHRGCCASSGSMCIIFASSVETVRRLSLLLQIACGQEVEGKEDSIRTDSPQVRLILGASGGLVAEMSRMVNKRDREKHIQAAMAGQVRVLVCSDSMARGIDLPGIRLVVNYDPPKIDKVYVHRAGRTARANLTGHCVTLLKPGQQAAFRIMRGRIHGGCNSLISLSSSSSSAKSAVGETPVEGSTASKISSLLNTGLFLEQSKKRKLEIDMEEGGDQGGNRRGGQEKLAAVSVAKVSSASMEKLRSIYSVAIAELSSVVSGDKRKKKKKWPKVANIGKNNRNL